MTTYQWNVVNTDYTTDGKFVVTCHYTVTATDGDYTASTYGTTSYTQEQGKSYVPYADLTEAECVGWVQTSIGKDTVEASLQAQIDTLKNPVQESGVPWTTAF